MPHRWTAIGLLLLLSVTLGACATIIEGDDQTVSVVTDPPGASCELIRDGQVVGIADPTPATVTLSKSMDDVSVVCNKPGYLESKGVLSSGFQVVTLGNAIIGGIFGVVVDAASGAINEYPDNVTVILTPEEFSNTDDRDAFFERRKSVVEERVAMAIGEIRKNCDSNIQDCEALIREVDAARDAKLEEIEAQRETVRIEAAG